MTIELLGRDDAEPPQPTPSFIVGCDGAGHWMAMAADGHAGGLFSSRLAAERYVAGETARRSGAILLAPDPIEFSLTGA